MMFRTAFAVVTGLAVATPALAAPAQGWTIDRSHSTITFAGAMNGQGFQGSFRRFDARIAFDPANLAESSVVAQIDTASAVTGDQTRDEALPTPDWFNAAVMPRALFRSTGFRALGGNRYQAIGTLTIRNVSRPVVLPFQLVVTGANARMQGSLAIDRRWFGIGQGQFATTDMVAARVVVTVSIAARKG